MLPGPPYAMTSTAICSAAMDEFHHGAHGCDVRLGKDAVTEIEDVPRTSPRAGEDVANLSGTFGGGREQGGGFEIALDCARFDAGPRGFRRTPRGPAAKRAASRADAYPQRRAPPTPRIPPPLPRPRASRRSATAPRPAS